MMLRHEDFDTGRRTAFLLSLLLAGLIVAMLMQGCITQRTIKFTEETRDGSPYKSKVANTTFSLAGMFGKNGASVHSFEEKDGGKGPDTMKAGMNLEGIDNTAQVAAMQAFMGSLVELAGPAIQAFAQGYFKQSQSAASAKPPDSGPTDLQQLLAVVKELRQLNQATK